MSQNEWSEWAPFPDPRDATWLSSPFGPGVYELRRDGELVRVGAASHMAFALTHLLPFPWGRGTRRKDGLHEFVWANIEKMEYRCCACLSLQEATELARRMLADCAYTFAE
jgi:hypothetical protein